MKTAQTQTVAEDTIQQMKKNITTYSDALTNLISLHEAGLINTSDMIDSISLRYFFRKYLALRYTQIDCTELNQWVHWVTTELTMPLISEKLNNKDLYCYILSTEPGIASTDRDKQEYNILTILQNQRIVDRALHNLKEMKKQ